MIEKISRESENTLRPPSKKGDVEKFEVFSKKAEKLHEYEDANKILEFATDNFKGGFITYSIEQLNGALKAYLGDSQSEISDLYDLTESELTHIVESYDQGQEVKEDLELEEGLNIRAHRLSERVDELLHLGKSNTEIISQILKEHQEGILDLPPEKFSLYKNFLELSTNQEFGEDNEVITSIINSSSINFDDPASFEIVLQKVFDNSQVSERTKIKIEKRFGIAPIRNGFELRKSVKDRERLVDEYRRTVQGITENLENLNYSIIEIEETIKKFVLEIEKSTTFDEQFELEDKRDELKKKLDDLKARRYQLETDKSEIQTRMPNKEVVLLNGRVISKDGQFFITMPDDQVYTLPEGLQNNELANTANGYFVWSILDRIGLAQVLFPEEDLQEGHLPTSKFTLTINLWLDKFHMSNSGRIMTLEELVKLEDIFDSLRSKSTLENKELSKEEGARIDLETMGVISNREVDYLKLNEVIEDMSLTKDGLYERDGS